MLQGGLCLLVLDVCKTYTQLRMKNIHKKGTLITGNAYITLYYDVSHTPTTYTCIKEMNI